ncbi:MAG: DUF1576 domain-containing protein [Defluviitaleaceae bacterium]|nr:DUF1576 domain-containing protein [Defluviitaleaceae bacterium]
MTKDNTWLQENFLKKPYRVHGALFVIFILQGFFYASPGEIIRGLGAIISGPDILVTDYIYTGGLGAAFVNVGLAGLLSLAVFVIVKHEPVGLTIGTLGLVTGFAFFGKNPLNMLPIILGGYFYAKFTHKHYRDCVLPAVLATCLAPVVTTLLHLSALPSALGLGLGVGIGIFIGFIMNPLAAAMKRSYEDFNLYNVGFASGILGLCLFALYRNLGIAFETLSIWSSGYNFELALFLAILSVYLITCGWLSTHKLRPIKEILNPNVVGHDYFSAHAEESYISMGALGLGCLAFMLAVRGDYSGPVIGAILSVVGFGAFGKALRSAAPIVAGAMLAACANWLITGMAFNSPGFLVAALFSTCLSPISKRYGVFWGIVAGFVHLSLASHVGFFHGGMNLYNNGFAGGFAAIMLLPVIRFFTKENEAKT